MADIQKAIVVSGVHTNIINTATGKSENYKEVLTWYDGSTMTNAKCDGDLYRRKGTKFLRKVIDKDGELFLEKDTMAQMRALSAYEVLLLKAGVVKGVRLSGYYAKGDTPAPIEYFLSTTVSVDDGGSVVDITGGKLSHEFVGQVDVRYFGVKAFDKTVDNGLTIQSVINYISQGNQLATSNGRGKTISLSEGKYYVTTPILIDKHSLIIQGTGNAVLCATDEFPKNTTDAILSIGQTADCKNTRVRGLTFTIDGGNPYDSYDGKFGSGLNYDFSNSVLGLKIDNTHYYVVSDCTFVGLRLGVWMRGAYAGRLVDCQFQWNNRHFQAIQVTARNNNWNNLTNCVFGNSIMNGGILLIECVNFSFSYCNIEQAFCTGLVTKNCRGVVMENMHFELHCKGSGTYASNSFHYQGTPYVFGTVTDNMNTNYDGYFVADDASLSSYVFKNSVFAVPHANQDGFIYQRTTRIKMRLESCTLASASTAKSSFMMLHEFIGVSRGYHLVNCSVRQPAKLGISPLILVEDTASYSPADYNRNNTFYVDFENGDDTLDAYQVSESTPLRTLTSLTNWIPKNSNQPFNIFIKGVSVGRKVINASFSNGGSLTITQQDTSDMNTLCIIPGSSGTINFNNITGRSITDYIFSSAAAIDVDRYNGLNINLSGCTLNSSEVFGVVSFNYHRQGNSVVNIKNSTCNWTEVGAGVTVRNGMDLYLDGFTSNKAVFLNGFGNIYYGVTNQIPVKGSSGFGRIVDILNINATTTVSGAVKQSTAVTNSSVADATDLDTALALVNDLKAKLNAILASERTSGQRAN